MCEIWIPSVSTSYTPSCRGWYCSIYSHRIYKDCPIVIPCLKLVLNNFLYIHVIIILILFNKIIFFLWSYNISISYSWMSQFHFYNCVTLTTIFVYELSHSNISISKSCRMMKRCNSSQFPGFGWTVASLDRWTCPALMFILLCISIT